MGNCISYPKGRKPEARDPSQSESTANAAATPVSETETNPQVDNELSTLVNAGYWPSWKIYDGLFPSTVAANVITHLLYAFADIDGDGSIFLKDEYVHYERDINGANGGLRACTQLKSHNSKLKVLLSVGGGEASATSNFVDVAGHHQKLQRFANSARNLVDQFSLDGVDMDWEHPSTKQQGIEYLEMMKALRKALPASRNYLLTTALPSDPRVLHHIPLAKLAACIDYLNLMAYDFVGPTYANVALTGHHAQLFSTKHGGPRISGGGAVEYLTERGFPAEKIVLGIPAYGHAFAGAGDLHEPFEKAGQSDEAPVRDIPNAGMEEIYDSDAVAVFAKGNGEFITYDNKTSVAEKARYVKRKGLAGLFYWTLASDRIGDESLVRAGFEVLMQ